MTEPTYALFGRVPPEIAAPGSAAEAQEWVRRSRGKAVVPWGGGTRQALGYPPERYDLALSTRRLDRITDYVPADLTVTAEAGVTVAHLQKALAAHGQRLPLDVALPERQTVGGIVAARAGSLRRASSGSVRDLLLGVTVVNARAELVKGGGKVVKNVAGYDLPKLYCGSLGTLGLITEATFRVAPVPETSATVALPLDAGHNSEDVLDHLFGSDLAPAFTFLLNPSAASALLPGAEPAQYVVVGFDGDAEAVGWQTEALGADPLSPTLSEQVRARLCDFALDPALRGGESMTAAFHILPSQVGAFSRMVEWTARKAGFAALVASDAALGLMTARFAPAREDGDWHVFYADLKDKAGRCGGSFILERMPDALRARDVAVWSPLLPDFALMAQLKKTLDPERMWNPGRFVGRL